MSYLPGDHQLKEVLFERTLTFHKDLSISALHLLLPNSVLIKPGSSIDLRWLENISLTFIDVVVLSTVRPWATGLAEKCSDHCRVLPGGQTVKPFKILDLMKHGSTNVYFSKASGFS